MNLTLHLLKKDLYRNRWSLSCWALGLAYLFLQTQVPLQGNNLRDYLQVSAMLVVVILGVGLVADFVQADHPTQQDCQWRTLPISAGRMVTVKLLLIGTIFVVVPMAAVCVRHRFDQGHSLHAASEYGLESLILAAIVFSLAAASACTKNAVHCLALLLALTFGAGTLASNLERFAPAISRKALNYSGLNKALVIAGLSVLFSLAVIFNQYLRRRPAMSIGLLLTGAVATALVGVFWGYFYFYHA